MFYMKKNIVNLFLNTRCQYLYLASLITILWILIHKKFSLLAWKIPLGYTGDNLILHGIMKYYSEFQWLSPLHQKFIPNLNLPDGANWSSWPITEEIPLYLTSILGSFIGVYPAQNMLLLFSYLAAGVTFFYVANRLKIHPALAFAGAFAFAFNNVLITRGLGHVTVGLVWHLPLMFLICLWAFRKYNFQINNKDLVIGYFFCFICGGFSPYYSIMFLMFLGFSFLVHLTRGSYKSLKFPFLCISLIILSFLIWNFDSFYNNFLYGENPKMQGRNIASLQLYALQLPELFYQPHSSGILGKIGGDFYFGKSMIKGEFWSPYLGLVGITSLLFLFFHSLYRIIKGKLKAVSIHFYLSSWVTIFSIVGGINLLIGTIGFTWLRATNRFSIFLLVISLLYFLRFSSRNLKQPLVLFLSILIILITYYEFIHEKLISKHDPSFIIEKNIERDIKLVKDIEAHKLNAKVFQLPVTHFPEYGYFYKMPDYQHLRPILHSNNLSFSYGEVNGRGNQGWQKRLNTLSPSSLINTIGHLGYDVILYNKLAYPDNGLFLRRFLEKNHNFVSETTDFVAFAINKESIKLLDNPEVFFAEGWSVDEVTHRWTNAKKSKILIFNFTDQDKKIELNFDLNVMRKSDISISLNKNIIKEYKSLISGQIKKNISLQINLNKGINTVEFTSSSKPKLAGNGDPRLLGTMLINFNYKIIE